MGPRRASGSFSSAISPGRSVDTNARKAGVSPDRRTIENALLQLGGVGTLARLGEHGPLQTAFGTGSLFSGPLVGRDALILALDMLDDFPLVAERTLRASCGATRISISHTERRGDWSDPA
jgi:hypothetical protein